jgi:transposase InsO family protein
VRRDFSATVPGQVWAGDRTEIVTSEGKLYLATVIDLFSRRLLGYAMGERHDAELLVASLHMAAATRGGDVRGVIFHSDRRQRRRIQPVVATPDSWAECRCSFSASAGVFHPSVLRGRLLRA